MSWVHRVAAVLLVMTVTPSFAMDDTTFTIISVRATQGGNLISAEVLVGDQKKGDLYNCRFDIVETTGHPESSNKCVHDVSGTKAGSYTYLGHPGQKTNEVMPWSYFASFEAVSKTVRFCSERSYLGNGTAICADVNLPN
jgi:hypothetical protein